MQKVTILLSTWNGMQFLPTQIDSLLSQDWPGDLSILVRDDGSTDGTVSFLRARDSRIKLIEGPNLGPKSSFLELLRAALENKADYYAFCDQDDFWEPKKVSAGVSALSGSHPAFYASAVTIVDERLEPIREYCHPGDRSFAATLMVNFATGCTVMFNRAFLELVRWPSDEKNVLMHDWWLASLATVDAEVRYDAKPLISYRQHSSNHVGANTGILSKIVKVFSEFSSKRDVTRFDHARQLLEVAGDIMDDEQRRVVAHFLKGEHAFVHRAVFAMKNLSRVGWSTAIRFSVFG